MQTMLTALRGCAAGVGATGRRLVAAAAAWRAAGGARMTMRLPWRTAVASVGAGVRV